MVAHGHLGQLATDDQPRGERDRPSVRPQPDSRAGREMSFAIATECQCTHQEYHRLECGAKMLCILPISALTIFVAR